MPIRFLDVIIKSLTRGSCVWCLVETKKYEQRRKQPGQKRMRRRGHMMLVLGRTNTIQIQNKYSQNTVEIQYKFKQIQKKYRIDKIQTQKKYKTKNEEEGPHDAGGRWKVRKPKPNKERGQLLLATPVSHRYIVVGFRLYPMS